MEEWPFRANVLIDASTRRVIRIDKQGNSIFHEGMNIGFFHDENEVIEIQRHVVAFKGDTLTLDCELEDHVLTLGLQCMLSARAPPADVRQYQPVDAMNAIQTLYETIVLNGDGGNKAWRQETLSVPGIQLTDDSSLDELNAAWVQQRGFMEELKDRAMELKVIGTEDAGTMDRFQKLQHILKTMCSIYDVMFSEKQLVMTMSSMSVSLSEPYVHPFWYTTQTTGEAPNDMVRLVEFLLSQTHRENIRKRGDVIYEEITVPCRVWKPSNPRRCRYCAAPAAFGRTERTVCMDHMSEKYCNDFRRRPDGVEYERDKDGRQTTRVARVVRGDFNLDESELQNVRTKSWRPRLEYDRPVTISHWLHKTIDRTTHYDLWTRMLSSYSRNVSDCEKFLQRTYDNSFKAVNVSSQFLSFRNGILDTAYHEMVNNKPIYSIRFYEYGSNSFDKDICTMNFIDDFFRPEWVVENLDKMEVPGYDDILTYQKYEKDMQQILDALLGRLLFPVKRFDKWEKLLVIYGEGGSGKSTIAHMIMRIIGHENIGLIASNCEEQWALANVVGKSMWICLELTLGFRLATGVLLSMVTGEHVVVNEKNKTAYQVMWKLHGLLIGNTLPLIWSNDQGGALSRRILPFYFPNRPVKQDSTFTDLFNRNIGKFCARILRRYHVLHTTKQDLNHSDLPAPLRQYLDEFEEKTNVLTRFFNVDAGAPFEIAPPAELKVIAYEMVRQKLLQPAEAERLCAVVSTSKNGRGGAGGNANNGGGAAADGPIAAFDDGLDVPLGMAAVQSVHPNPRAEGSLELVEEWSVPHKDFVREFKDWLAREAPKNTFDINDKNARESTAKKHGLMIQRGVQLPNGLKTKELHWYGIRRRLNNDL